MGKIFAVVMVAALLTACSTTNRSENSLRAQSASLTPPNRVITTGFQETNGAINLTFDESGNWITLSTSGVADISDDSVAAQESALSIATLRAKRNLSEFLNSNLKSTKTLDSIARSHQRAVQKSNINTNSQDSETDESLTASPNEVSERSRQLAKSVNEKIVDSSSAILRGIRITQQQISGDRAIVIIEASQQSIQASKNIQRQMTGMMH